MMQRPFRFAAGLLAIIATLFLSAGLCTAGKPQPVPPPEGTIYFTLIDPSTGGEPDVVVMNADGGDKALALPTGSIVSYRPAPSALTYGGEPLWLLRGDELTILRREADGSASRLQLTQVRPTIFNLTDLRWANSGKDEFLSFKALVRDDAGDVWASIIRLHVSGEELTDALDAGGSGWTPFGADDPRLEIVHAIPFSQGTPNPGGSDGLNIGTHDWSPDGTQLAYTRHEYDPNEGGTAASLVIRDLVSDTEETILGGGFYDRLSQPRWSPDGSRIAIDGLVRTTSRKTTRVVTGIFTITPEGSDFKVLVPDPNQGTAGSAEWSPDGLYLVFDREIFDQRTLSEQSDLVRVRADGSGATVLTNVMDPVLGKLPLAWR